MLKTFPIEFIRQVLEQTLLEEHIKNKEFFGGKDQVNIMSFYEQLKSQEEVDRFVENYRQLTDQQNRSGLILNGVILSPENPSITNLYSCSIIPMSWTCSLRCQLPNRDQAIETINNLIEKLKGKKVDVAQLECVDDFGKKYYAPFKVGTIGQGQTLTELKDKDYIDSPTSAGIYSLYQKGVSLPHQRIVDDFLYLYSKNGTKLGVVKATPSYENICDTVNFLASYLSGQKYYIYVELAEGYTFSDLDRCKSNVSLMFTKNGQSFYKDLSTFEYYCEDPEFPSEGFVVVDVSGVDFDSVDDIDDVVINAPYPIPNGYTITQLVDDNSTNRIVFPQEHISFEKYKLSFSFDAIRCDEPRNLNEKEYCELTFSGNATLVSEGVGLGNDLLKISMKKLRIDAQTTIDFTNAHTYFLEPLEMPSGSNANTQINQIVSNKFLANSHTDSLALTLQYTFIYDKNIDLLKQLFDYARYGTQGLTESDISPNMIYQVDEHWCSWGEYEKKSIETKIVENIDIQNTESDTLTIGMTMQIQRAV